MFDQIKDMISDNKQLLLGGIASGLIYYGNFMAKEQPWYPPELKQQLEPHLPPNGDLLAAVAPPAVLYSIVKFGKKTKIQGIADGSVYFGVGNITSRVAVQAAWTEGKAIAPPAARITPAVASKYIANASINRVMPTSSLSKYAVTS